MGVTFLRVGGTLGGGYLDGVAGRGEGEAGERYSWWGHQVRVGRGSGDEESPKNNFNHLEYGRDHGPDHLHKGKF